MQLVVSNLLEKILPAGVHGKLLPALEKVDDLLNSDNENSVSQRMALTVFVIRVASAAIALLSQILLARWMGTFEYGIFVAVWAAVIISSTLTGLGLPSAVLRFVSEYREREQPNLFWGVVRGSLLMSLATATALALLGALLLTSFPGLMTNYFIMPVYLGLVCLPAFNIEGVADMIGRPFNWIKLSFLPTFIVRPLSILALLGFAILIGYEATAITAMWCALIATYSTTIFQTLLLFRKLEINVKPAPAEYRLGYWLMVALPIFLVESFYVLLTQVDVIFVSWLTTPEDTAVYFAATKILALVHFVYFAIRATASHRYAAYNASGKLDEYREFVQKTVQWTFWPSLAIGITMVLCGKYILMLFGPEFVVGESVLWILVAGIVIRSSIGPAEALLVMSGKQNACAVIYCGALFINVTLNICLIPIYGLQGAAIATAIAFICESAALYSAVLRHMKIHAFVIPSRRSMNAAGEGSR